MPVGVTTTSREVYELHMLVFWICVVIGAGVYAAMVAAILKFRKSKGAVAAKFTHNATVEVVWTVIPAAILVAMAVPAAETLIRMEDTRNSELTIKVTGYQWRWHYDYIDDGIGFYSTLDRESNAARRTGSGIDPTTVDNYLLKVDNDVVVPVGDLPTDAAVLIVRSGPQAGDRFTLKDGVTRLGRHPDSEIILDDITVSRRHVEIERTDEGYVVTDAGSLNGTYVNQERVDRAVLHHGDELQIGKFRLVLFERSHA